MILSFLETGTIKAAWSIIQLSLLQRGKSSSPCMGNQDCSIREKDISPMGFYIYGLIDIIGILKTFL